MAVTHEEIQNAVEFARKEYTEKGKGTNYKKFAAKIVKTNEEELKSFKYSNIFKESDMIKL